MESDASLVDRTVRGEIAAFEVLVDRHRPVVERVAARIVGERDAEDVVQDSFLRAFNTLHGFRGDAAFKTWLLVIARNTALTALARRRDDPLDDDDGEPSGTSAQASPARTLEDLERRERLRSKLRQLRGPHRSVLVLRDMEGLSYNEIADITDMPLGTVKGRLYRAREELIELLRNNTYDWELPE